MSQIAIWNLALGRLGDGATVGAPDERSRQAELWQDYLDCLQAAGVERDQPMAPKGGSACGHQH